LFLEETYYWVFNTNLTSSQWRALRYLQTIHETTNDEECNKILGKYLDSIKIPDDFHEVDYYDGYDEE